MGTGAAWWIERGLYLFLSLVMWAIAVAGFWPGYIGPALDGTLDKTGAVHLHVVVYVGWLVLFTLQSTLPMARKGRLHRKVGRFGIGYGVLVWIVGFGVTFSRFGDRVRAGDMAEASFQVLPPFTDMLVFPVLFGLAIHYRTRPEIHKRLMVVTGTMLMVAAASRMILTGLIESPLVVLAIWLSPILIAVAHDGWFQRRLHPVYGFGFFGLVVLNARLALVETEGWRAVTAWAAETFVS